MSEIYEQRDQILKEVKDKVDDIYKLLRGDGTDGNPGAIIRLDRLEQWRKEYDRSSDHAWQWRVGLAIPIIVLLIERAIHFMKGGGH